MITVDNFKQILLKKNFEEKDSPGILSKTYPQFDVTLKADFHKGQLVYPESIKGGDRNTLFDAEHPENMVVFECVDRLLDKGYRPEDIELEKEWHLGHDSKGGRADICVSSEGKMLFIIECKTPGKEYNHEKSNMELDGGQLFSYWQQERSCKWLILYASDYETDKVTYTTHSIDCSDDENLVKSFEKDKSIKLFKESHTVDELFEAWSETYDKQFAGDVIFRDDSCAYQIGVKPLRKKDLIDFSESKKLVNGFEEILRHNNVSDKENAFNRLTALFICKLVDEIQKSEEDEVDFQYKQRSDSYESLQDRLQKLHKEGMDKFMREEIFYVSDDYAENLIKQYTGQRRQKMIEDLKRTINILKFYTNNDFAFKDVHNEELFYQNGKILVEVVKLFQPYRIIGSDDLQTLGDMFENLLNKGFKQNEGQFFTPMPITGFIWDSLPLEQIIKRTGKIEYPKIIDYACGAGHFLTQGYQSVTDWLNKHEPGYNVDEKWVENRLYGVEKDYRLARVSKISLFMHGAGFGNIIFGDGLENYSDRGIVANSFDILVANPPYSVKGFKPHLILKNNSLEILSCITESGNEIETLFIERIHQLLKPNGVAAVILPQSVLFNNSSSYRKAREIIVKNFKIKSLVELGSKTFGETGTSTVIFFLEKYNEPPKRSDLVADSVESIFERRDLRDWEDDEILKKYLKKINVSLEDYDLFISENKNYDSWRENVHFAEYVKSFEQSSEVKNKLKQKSFINKTEEEKKIELSRMFYNIYLAVEKIKLNAFSLTYDQKTLIITSPDDNSGQEEFIGYSWSKRKGQEGIQPLPKGGKLYNKNDHDDPQKISAIIREHFQDVELDQPDLKTYCRRLRTSDLFDYSKKEFDYVFNTKYHELIIRDGWKLFKLNDESLQLLIGNRVLESELVEGGKYPVYSANVNEPAGKIDKLNLNDFSRPSILWGIDGDWMVGYLEPNQEFYPTDHCGVLRNNNPDIDTKYLAAALFVEGKKTSFSRSKRANIEAIKSLTIPLPPLNEQKNISSKLEKINSSLKEKEKQLNKYNDEVKSRFIELFGVPTTNEKGWPTKTLKEVAPSKQPDLVPKSEGNWLLNLDAIKSNSGEVLFKNRVASDELEGSILSFSKDHVLYSKLRPYLNKVVIPDEPGYGTTELIPLLPDKKLITQEYLAYLLRSDAFVAKFSNAVAGAKMPRVSMDTFWKFSVPLPPLDLQKDFGDFVKQIDKSRSIIKNEMDALIEERNSYLKSLFDL